MQHLMGDILLFPVKMIQPGISVFAVPYDRMSDGGKMGPDLMAAPGDQMYLQ